MAKQPSKKLHEQEHPDIDLSDLILPKGLIDASWHNNAMPIFHTSLVDPHKQETIDELTSKPPYAHEHRAVLSIQTKNPVEREYNDPDHIKLGWNNRFGVSLEFVESGILMEPPPPLARYTWNGEDEGMAYKVLLAFQYAVNVWEELDGQYRGEPAAWDEMTLQFSREKIPYFAGEPEKQDFTLTNFAADYCDDNMALLNAYVSIYGENPLDSDEQDMSIRYGLGDPPHQVEMDEAREIAVKMIFIPEGKLQNNVRSMYDAAKWDTVDGLVTASGNVLPIYKIKDRGMQVVASTPEGEEVTRPDAPVCFALYVSEAMDGKHLIKTFPNSRKALEFVKEFENDILKAFFLYGEIQDGSTMPSDDGIFGIIDPSQLETPAGKYFPGSPAFKTNIKEQTVEYQNIDQLILKNGYVILIGDESLQAWKSVSELQSGHDAYDSISFPKSE